MKDLYQCYFQSSLIMNTVNISVEIVIAVVFRHTTSIQFLARDIERMWFKFVCQFYFILEFCFFISIVFTMDFVFV